MPCGAHRWAQPSPLLPGPRSPSPIRSPQAGSYGLSGRLLRLASSAARFWIRSSSVITCQRVPRRSPVRRTRPVASSSRRRRSTSAGSPFDCLASAAVVSPSLPKRSRSTVSAGTALAGLDARLRVCFARGLGAGAGLPFELSAVSASSSDAISPFSPRMRPSIAWTRSSMVVDMPPSYGWHQTASRAVSGRVSTASCASAQIRARRGMCTWRKLWRELNNTIDASRKVPAAEERTSKETNVRDDPQEGDHVVESKTGHAGTVVDWEEHDPSTVYVLFDYQRPSSEPKRRLISDLTVVSKA